MEAEVAKGKRSETVKSGKRMAKSLWLCLHCPAVWTTVVQIAGSTKVMHCNSSVWMMRVRTKRFVLINAVLFKQGYNKAYISDKAGC